MHVTLLMVQSVNGKITRGIEPDVTAWTSLEDKALFAKEKANHTLVVMSAGSYRVNKDKFKLSSDILRVVITRDPKKYESDVIANQLEFTNNAPRALMQNLESRGYTKLLLLGGPEINALFLKENLVDELHLTIEPLLFGTGKNLISNGELSTHMHLINIEKLNDTGTLHAIYRINKS